MSKSNTVPEGEGGFGLSKVTLFIIGRFKFNVFLCYKRGIVNLA